MTRPWFSGRSDPATSVKLVQSVLACHLRPVVNDNFFPVLGCIFIVDNDSRVAIAQYSVAGPILATDGHNLRVYDYSLVVNIHLNVISIR